MPSLASQAEELLAQAKEIDKILEQNNIPYPSFSDDTLEQLPDHAQAVRREIVNKSHAFQQLVRGARQSGLDMSFTWTEQLVLRIIWQYKLASAVPLDGSASYDEISAASGLSRSIVARTIRAAVALNIFDEQAPGQVRHSAVSRLLAVEEGYYSMIGLQVEDWAPASTKLLEVWKKFGDETGEPEQSAFSISHGGRSLFTILSEDPVRASRFDSAMKYSVEDKEFDSFDVVEAYDWSSLDKPGWRLVDLGGGYGQLSQALAKKTQHLAFTVQDLPHVAQTGREKLPPEFQDRITFEGRNFLELQQAQETPPNAFLISRCLHNWSDHHSSAILRALIPALRKGSKVLIWDTVLDDSPSKNLSDKFNFQQDFIMATISNGKDRSAAEFRQLVESSDEHFKVDRVRRPEGSKLSMVEVTWDG